MTETVGKIIQIIGPVIDVKFDSKNDLPAILDALIIKTNSGKKIYLECQLHIGNNKEKTYSNAYWRKY